jgi:hypothetical protein
MRQTSVTYAEARGWPVGLAAKTITFTSLSGKPRRRSPSHQDHLGRTALHTQGMAFTVGALETLLQSLALSS